MKKFPAANLLPVFLLVVIFFTANAQKLPNVQQISVRAPVNIKIDGNADEWDNKFQAYNKATDIYYTLANNDKILYLTIQTPDRVIMTKIMFGGLVFAINRSGKKDLKETVNITYPAFEKGKQNMVYIVYNETKARPDSFAMVNNSQLAAKSKFIRVTGIKGIDTLISVYNQDGIKAVSSFDNKMVYTYELAVDLSLLGLNVAKPEKFAYNIALPGLRPVTEELNKHGILLYYSFTPAAHSVSNPDNPHGYRVDVPTDFWGEYTLAEK